MGDREVIETYFGGLTLEELGLPEELDPIHRGSNYIELTEQTVDKVLKELQKGKEKKLVKKAIKQNGKSLSLDQLQMIMDLRQAAYNALLPPPEDPEG